MDRLSKRQRSELMAKIRAKGTNPELAVRKALRGMGYVYRLHRSDLPGKPDIVMAKRRVVIFVHGCFWHGHKCAAGQNIPATNKHYWLPKLMRNKQRDSENIADLRELGWKVVVIWECETRDSKKIESRLNRMLSTHKTRRKKKRDNSKNN